MNETELKGAAAQVAGRFEKTAGDLLENTEMRVGGRLRERIGRIQEAAGAAQEILGKTVESAMGAATNAGKAYESVTDSARDVIQTIEDRSLVAVAVAAAVGLLAGMLIAGRGPKIVYVKPPS